MRLPVWRRREVTRPRNLLIVAMVLLMLSSVVLLTGARHAPLVLRVIAKGADIHGSNGINFGPDGNLYIATVFGQEIVVMNPRNGKILNRLGLPDVVGPDDLVFGPDGSLYWTEIVTGHVGRKTPDGLVTKQFVAMGVNPITFSPDGRLFVGLCFYGDGLYELDPELTDPPRPVIEATSENPYPLGFLNAFDFGDDGRLYGPVFALDMVISVDVGQPADPPSASPWTDGTIKIIATGFDAPAAAKFDSQGRLHVVDSSGAVYRVDVATGAKTLVAMLSPGNDNLAFDARGNLFVSNYMDGSITQVLPSGQARIMSRGGMTFAMGGAVLPRPGGGESVFVANYFTLHEFDGRTGKSLNVIHRTPLSGSEDDPLTLPLTVAADGDGYLVVTSYAHGTVQVYDPWEDEIIEDHHMAVPINAIRFQDDLVVVDLVLGGVVWASGGAMILPMDGANVVLPLGLATDGEKLWVGDWVTGIIWQVDFAGKTPHAPVPIAYGLANPEGLAVDIDGSLLVVEEGRRCLSRVDVATGDVSFVVGGLAIGKPPPVPGWAWLPYYGLSGVAVGPSGAIYISGDVNNVLYRIWPR